MPRDALDLERYRERGQSDPDGQKRPYDKGWKRAEEQLKGAR